MSAGYYGIPGFISYGKVHVADRRGPICHTPVNPDARFQWCAREPNAALVECLRCRKILGYPRDQIPKRV